MLLKITRIVLIVGGLALVLFGLIDAFDGKANQVTGGWSCGQPTSSSDRVECGSQSLKVADHSDVIACCVSGVALICAAIAVGQFDRRAAARPAAGPGPYQGPPSTRPAHPGGPQGPQSW